MLQFFGGGGSGAPTFTKDPTSGHPTLKVGTGTFGGGAPPDFQGISVLGINTAAGYVGNLFDFQQAGVSFLALESNGAGSILTFPSAGNSRINFGNSMALAQATAAAAFFSDAQVNDIAIRGGTGGGSVLLGAFTNGGSASTIRLSPDKATIAATLTTSTPLQILGIALQTADLFQNQDSSAINQFGIANNGTGAAPKWGLRVAPVANPESMAQAHVGGASTGRAIQVIDNAGTSLGWLQLVN